MRKIYAYGNGNNSSIGRDFVGGWERNMYTLRGWAIVMSEGGSLKSHNHEKGLLTGTFYLQMPEPNENPNDGAIVFSHEGPRYPKADSVFPERIIRPKSRDLNIFSSSLFRKTLPFKGDKKRVCIALDLSIAK